MVKDGAGDLDFTTVGKTDESESESNSGATESASEQSDTTPLEPGVDPTSNSETNSEPMSISDPQQFPYFVRRNNVGDERDHRLEIHVRDAVTEQESAFRNELTKHLDTDDVAKTDAREFALLYAYENPDDVAELMREEGYGLTD